MNFENPNDEKENIEKDKKEKLEQIRQGVEKWADKLGKGVDEGIKDTVIFLNALDLPTSDSCEGHIERGLPLPYAEIEAPNKPKERFIGEKEIFEKIAKKYNITAEEAESAKIDKAYWEAIKECSKNGETEQFKKWREENKELINKAENLLTEFYQEREVEPRIKLKINEQAEGSFRIHSGGEDYQPIIEEEKEFSEGEKKERAEKLKKYRVEMEDFTKFLIDKYLGS